MFLVIKKYQKKCEKKKFDLLLIGDNAKFTMFKDFNKFIYDHTLYRGQKHFWRFCLQALSIEKKIKTLS